MEIKECKSKEYVIREIKQKLSEIMKDIKQNYRNNLCIYYDFWSEHVLAEVSIGKTTFFGKVIHEYKVFNDIIKVSFDNRELKVTILDPSEFLYPLIKEEFTKLAEENKNNIQSVCFIKDF